MMLCEIDSLRAGVKSVTGNFREHNEDRVYADTGLGLFIVADGMGGSLAGERASAMAVHLISTAIDGESPRPSVHDSGHDAAQRFEPRNTASYDPHVRAIQGALLYANREILALSHARSECHGMGTTAVVALLRDRKMYVAGIGDSRAHRIRRGRIEQLTTDHSLAQSLVESGILSAKEAGRHPLRNVLWKYLGSPRVHDAPALRVVSALNGDRFVLSSDGLTGVMSEQEIARRVCGESDVQKTAERLVEHALAAGSRDNVSCIAIFID